MIVEPLLPWPVDTSDMFDGTFDAIVSTGGRDPAASGVPTSAATSLQNEKSGPSNVDDAESSSWPTKGALMMGASNDASGDGITPGSLWPKASPTVLMNAEGVDRDSGSGSGPADPWPTNGRSMQSPLDVPPVLSRVACIAWLCSACTKSSVLSALPPEELIKFVLWRLSQSAIMRAASRFSRSWDPDTKDSSSLIRRL